VQFPKGYKTPLHTHEGPGPRYVLKGKLKVEDGGQSNVFSPGEVFWETGAEMTVENVGKGEAEIIIFEMAPAKTAAH
jgi:quercetin dioxygenase-like cupin family protein